ncbi:MAG: phosphate uptake regulator, PhoU [Bacteroidetes bacterium]|nr:phosphate uptake regulator, PhoU [Bacteroidota bacterium]
MERHFQRDLEQLKSDLIRMGSSVDEQCGAACHALFEGDLEEARRVILADKAIDEFDNLIDRQVQSILALNQPVAADLRLGLAALMINTQLERIGDIAVNIAERATALAGHRDFVRGTKLREMADIARIMVRDSLDAFIHSDAGIARRVLDSDDVVDRLNRTVFRQVVDAMRTDHDVVEPGAHALILSRHIERLADHATNIAEDVIFLVEARLVRHQDRS